MRRWTAGRILLHVAVSAAFIAILVWRGDAAGLVVALRTADWRWVALAVVLVAASKVMHGVRWWLLVRRAGAVPLVPTVLVLLAATGVSVVLPLRAGAAVQLQVLRRRYGIERTAVVGTLVAEGLVDAAMLLLLALIAVPFIGLEQRVVLGLLAVVIGVGVLVGVIAVLGGSARDQAWRQLLPLRLRRPVGSAVAGIARGLTALDSIMSVTLILLATCSDWLLATAAHWLVGHAFGLQVPLYVYLAVEVVGNLTGAMPITQANVGPYELAVRETLAVFGVGGGPSAAFAVATHAAIIAAEAGAGLLAAWLLRLGREDLLYLRADAAGGDAPTVEPPARGTP